MICRLVSFRVGTMTARNNFLMDRFKADSQNNVIKTLKELHATREFIQPSTIVQGFKSRIQTFLLKQKSEVSLDASLSIYQIMKQLEMVQASFKNALFDKYYEKLTNNGSDLKNRQIQQLLWFMMKQCPFRNEQFLDSAQLYTLRLIDMYQYMQSLSFLPAWQPYLRIVSILKHVGHEQRLRGDITNMKQITRINYKYIPTLGSLFSKQQASNITKINNLYTPFKNYLARTFQQKSNFLFNHYLYNVQKYEIHQSEEQTDRTFDVETWNDIVAIFQLVQSSINQEFYDQELVYKQTKLLLRKFQTSNIDYQSGIKLIHLLSQKLHHDNNSQKISLRIMEGLSSIKGEDIIFVPSNGILLLIESLIKLNVALNHKQQLIFEIKNIVPNLIYKKEQQISTINEKISEILKNQ